MSTSAGVPSSGRPSSEPCSHEDASQQHIVVTGGGSGIGRAAALLATAQGARVTVLDRDGAAADGTAASAGGRNILALECDVASESALSRCLDEAESRLGPITGLIAAAGVDRGGPAHTLPVETWLDVLEVNLTGAFLSAREVIRRMRLGERSGAVVLCSSPAAFVGFAAGGASAYAASKGGVSALTRSLAVDYGPHGIRVNALVPGATETPLMWAAVPLGHVDEMRMQVEREVPLGRLANPDEPARAALWLLSPEASYVTGSHLVCDGGVLAKASISV
jgi:NAD(P)-dependent dehydrogenase (short-subunit alcohol dehydrogenase family)